MKVGLEIPPPPSGAGAGFAVDDEFDHSGELMITIWGSGSTWVTRANVERLRDHLTAVLEVRAKRGARVCWDIDNNTPCERERCH